MKDKKKSCKGWASGGYCTSTQYRLYMKKYCCMSCLPSSGHNPSTTMTTYIKKIKKLPSNNTSCKDKRSGCQDWAQAGYCEEDNYVKYMKDVCCKSCTRKQLFPCALSWGG